MPDGIVYLSHCVLLSALWTIIVDTQGGGTGNKRVIRERIAWPLKVDIEHSTQPMLSFCLRQWEQAHKHHCIHNSHPQHPGLYGPFFGDTENIITICGYCGKFSFLCPRVCQPDSMLCHVLGFTEDNFCILGLSHLASLLQGGVGFEPCMPSIALSTRSFNHQISGLHWWLYKRPQISVAASSRGPFSIDKSDTTQCAVPALAPAVVATAATTVVDFTFKAD